MKNLLKQALKFVGVSGIGWILDFGVYLTAGKILNNLILANIVSSWVGVTFVFLFATQKIFKNSSKLPLKWKYLFYLGYQLILILLISRLLGRVNQFILNNIRAEIICKLSPIFSKMIITPITMILNFIVMKNVIEKL